MIDTSTLPGVVLRWVEADPTVAKEQPVPPVPSTVSSVGAMCSGALSERNDTLEVLIGNDSLARASHPSAERSPTKRISTFYTAKIARDYIMCLLVNRIFTNIGSLKNDKIIAYFYHRLLAKKLTNLKLTPPSHIKPYNESISPEALPITTNALAITPTQLSLSEVDVLQVCESSQTRLPGGYVVDKAVQIEVRGDRELLQKAGEALRSLHEKPSNKTFRVTLEDGTQKEYYRAQFGLHELLSAGQILATDCEYPANVIASLERCKNRVVYACITFKKRIDHATNTYQNLRKEWNIKAPEKPLAFAVTSGIWGGFMSDSMQKIVQLEQKRADIINKFCKESYRRGVPKDHAFTKIYRPTHDERLKFLADYSNPVEYIAATDCIMFIYREVPNN